MKTTIPTDSELKQDILAAREALRLTRVEVANGSATSDQLAEAESALRFAETRLAAAGEARQERRRQQDRERAGEIVQELAEVRPLIEQQREREEAIRAMVTEYLDAANEIRAEVYGAYVELLNMRDRDRDRPKVLPEFGIRVASASSAVVVNGETYGAPEGLAFLRELEREAGNKGGRLSPKPKTAQRPARRKEASDAAA